MIFFIYWYLLLQARHFFSTQSFSFKNHRVMLKAFSLVNPNCFFFCLLFFFHEKEKWVVGTNGLEPSTSRLSGVRSNHLSYAPFWWRWGGSNSWPPACKAGALPAELHPHVRVSLGFSSFFCRHSFSLSILKIEQCFLSTCSPLLTEALNFRSCSLERRWSSRTFRYGYLVTTSPQSSIPP